jgi:hypothetical protein
MTAESSERQERRLDQPRRMAASPVDPLTKERLQNLVRILEAQLSEPEE